MCQHLARSTKHKWKMEHEHVVIRCHAPSGGGGSNSSSSMYAGLCGTGSLAVELRNSDDLPIDNGFTPCIDCLSTDVGRCDGLSVADARRIEGGGICELRLMSRGFIPSNVALCLLSRLSLCLNTTEINRKESFSSISVMVFAII